jgi:hypothetical protein
MSINTVSDLRNAIGTGANPSKFSIDISIPILLRASSFVNHLVQSVPLIGASLNQGGATTTPDNFTVLAKATTLPEKNVSTVDVWHRGHKYIVRGVADFTHRWDVTFYNTADLGLRQFFEGWMYEMDRFDSTLLSTTFPNNYFGLGSLTSGYMTNIKVNQLCDNKISAGYEFFYAFPINISATELNASSTNTVSEFTVTFAFSYWLPHNKTTIGDVAEMISGGVASTADKLLRKLF